MFCRIKENSFNSTPSLLSKERIIVTKEIKILQGRISYKHFK